MTNLVHLRSSRRVHEEAAGWIVCMEEGLSDEQTRELKAWLGADPAHRAALVKMAEQSDAFEALSELAEILPLREVLSRKNGFAVAGAGLVAIAVAAIAVGLYLWRDPSAAADRTAQVAPAQEAAPSLPALTQESSSLRRTLRTDVGQHLTAAMPDGSSISLNTNTALGIYFTQGERLVILERGEASFSVAHDSSRPFRVRAGERTVQAVGTVFNVRRDAGSNVRLTVTEGVVRVIARPESKSEDVLVRAGQLAEIGEATANIQRVDPSRLDAAQAWQRGVLIYQGETLEDVIADVSRYTSVRFEIEDDSIRQRRVGGVFRAGDVDGLLLALRESFGIEPRQQGDLIVLSAK